MADHRGTVTWLYRSMLMVFILFISICLWAHHPQYEWGTENGEGYGGMKGCCCMWPVQEIAAINEPNEPDSMFYIEQKEKPVLTAPVPVPPYVPEIKGCPLETHRHEPWKHRVSRDSDYLPQGLTKLNRGQRPLRPEMNGEEADLVLYLRGDGRVHARELLYASSEAARDSLYAAIPALRFEKFRGDSIKPVRIRLLWREGRPLFY